MKKIPIGHVTCPVCDFPDAEVKEDKNGHAYIHCTDCNAQTFTRNDHRNGKLRARMRPVTGTAPLPLPIQEPEPAAPKAATPAPKAPTTTQHKAPPAPAKRAGWFTPILAGEK